MADKKSEQDARLKQFLNNVKKSGLLSGDQFSEITRRIKKQVSKTGFSQKQFLEICLESDLLSQWQCRQLMDGRFRGFFLGSFKLMDVLGSGGMSTVYLAEHTLSGQKRAIKILPRKKLKQRSYLTRFYREARAIAALQHPNIIRIYDISNDEDETHFMVMEFVKGSDLHAKVRADGPIDFELCRDCIRQASDGLAHAHAKQLIHRDVKPANLFLTNDGVIKVLDLGLALLKTDENQFGLSVQHKETMMGTADYLAPEQAVNSHNVDHRADIYSLGCTLYYMLTGQPPFPRGTLAQRIAAHQSNQPQSVFSLRRDCPPDLDQLCRKMMCKDPGDRFQSCGDIITALETGIVSETSIAVVPDKLVSTQTNSDRTDSERIRKIAVRKRRKNLPIVLVLLALILFVVVLFVLQYNGVTGS